MYFIYHKAEWKPAPTHEYKIRKPEGTSALKEGFMHAEIKGWKNMIKGSVTTSWSRQKWNPYYFHTYTQTSFFMKEYANP